MSLWCVFRWIMYDRKEKRRRIEQIKSKKLQVQKQRDLIDVEGQKTIASVDTVDGSSSDDDYEQYAMKIERPLFFRAISWWAYLELFIVAYTLLTKRQEDFPENFLHGFCYNNSCSRIVTRALCYKILSSVLLAFGAKLVSLKSSDFLLLLNADRNEFNAILLHCFLHFPSPPVWRSIVALVLLIFLVFFFSTLAIHFYHDAVAVYQRSWYFPTFQHCAVSTL